MSTAKKPDLAGLILLFYLFFKNVKLGADNMKHQKVKDYHMVAKP